MSLAHASASNLYGFASRAWLGRLLDPKQIAGPQFFGKTKHKAGDMVDFVTGKLHDPKIWKPGQVKQVIAALSAEAHLPDQRAVNKTEQSTIDQGRLLLKDSDHCGECHRFHGTGADVGTAPDLTDYGSTAWLTAFMSNPAHERFYGTNNDRMPAFAKGTDPKDNLFSPKQLRILANWLRGDWDAPAIAP